MSGAFHGSTETKLALMNRLDASLDAYPSDYENDDPAGILALTVGVDDVQAYVDATGYPIALAMLQPRIFNPLVESARFDRETMRRDAFACARSWLSVVSPGADLSGVPARVLTWMLRDIANADPQAGEIPELASLVDRLIEMHERHAVDGSVGRKTWSALRTEAMSVTDTLPQAPVRWVGNAIESAAWDPATSSVILTDVLRAFKELRIIQSVQAIGWTREEGQRSHDVLQGIFDETQPRRDAGEIVSIPTIFRERQPAMEARYVEHLDEGAKGVAAGFAQLYRLTVDELALAGIPG